MKAKSIRLFYGNLSRIKIENTSVGIDRNLKIAAISESADNFVKG